MGAKSSKKDGKEELEQPPPSAKPKPSPFGEPEQFQQQNNAQPSTKGFIYFTYNMTYTNVLSYTDIMVLLKAMLFY